MSQRWLIAAFVLPAASTWIGCGSPADVKFKMHTVNADSRFEGAGVLDVDNDGELDIVCGGSWYRGPTWEKHFLREVEERGGYYLDFCALPVDIDGDGWTDVVTVAWHNERISWIRNPGRPTETRQAWEEIVVDEPGHMETAILADVNGDGQPDVVPNIFHGEPGWYTFHRDPAAPHGVRWDKHVLPAEMAGAGVGAGDINGDGRCDIVGVKGWAEQPADPHAPWEWHGDFDLADPSIPIPVCDLDRDGDADLVWGIGHGYGTFWLEQRRSATGRRVWSRHEIDCDFSQAHVVLLGDLTGDGRPEMITGKRWHAHNGKDPGGNEPRCLYWYHFEPRPREWRRHTIHEGGPAGTGTMTELVDIDRDGDLDFVAPGKSGLYLFENLRR